MKTRVKSINLKGNSQLYHAFHFLLTPTCEAIFSFRSQTKAKNSNMSCERHILILSSTSAVPCLDSCDLGMFRISHTYLISCFAVINDLWQSTSKQAASTINKHHSRWCSGSYMSRQCDTQLWKNRHTFILRSQKLPQINVKCFLKNEIMSFNTEHSLVTCVFPLAEGPVISSSSPVINPPSNRLSILW